MNEWEYKTYFMSFKLYDSPEREGYRLEAMTDAQLTALGSQGWELVSVVRLTRQSHEKGTIVWSDEGTWGLHYIFKRPKRIV
jgi:hypothetical protein